jgi:YidC/Oxa1 family membrane protein insertase
MTPVLANVLQPVIDVFEEVLIFFHDTVGFGWGFSIIALTLTIRALLLPIALKQVKSMRGMQLIAPQMKQVQERYKDDKQRQQEELMKLYRENKVNPFASCLPLLAQMPVFISLFYMLRKDLRHDICPDINPTIDNTQPCGPNADSGFFFIPDITDKATGAVLITLLILYVGSQLASSLLMSMTADKTQRRIFLIMPFAFVPFILSFPAGLLVYWITTNLWTIVQQLIVRKTVGPPPAAVAAAAGKGGKGDDDAPKSGGLRGALRAPKPAAASSGATGGAGSNAPRRTTAPPPPPSKRKKKRSGRRR